MVPNPPQGLDRWAYQPLMEWTCQWAAGQDDEKDICDAILRSLSSAGLRCGVLARSVREMLLQSGAMCGVWYQAFQQMAHCQGIFLRSVWASGTNGMTVRTTLIPDQVGANTSLTFYWGP